jgi:fructokinase
MLHAGVELGGTKCVAMLARSPEDVLARELLPTTSPQETLGRIERLLLDWKATHGVDSLGIASFGPLDLDRCSATFGHMRATPKAGWAGANVAPRLSDAIGVPTVVDTDVNGAALAEIRWGSGRGFDDFAYVTVGTGVGVGLIVNGRPTRGFAHCELGHVRVPRFPGETWPGSCPFHGDCVEGMASGTSLEARFGEKLGDIAPDHPVWESLGWTLAQLCHVIVCAGAPRRIAMAGGVMEHQPHLFGRIRSMLGSLNGYIQLPPDDDYVGPPELGSNAGPLGAIALAMGATE